MPKARPKSRKNAKTNQSGYNNRLVPQGLPSQSKSYMRPNLSHSIVDDEVSRLSSLSNLATLSTFAQMTPNMPDQLYQSSSRYCTLPYSPIALPPHGLGQSPLNIPQHVSSPRKTQSMKGMSREEFDAVICKRIEDRVESALSKVDSGLDCLQREIQVKERLRMAVAQRQAAAALPIINGSSPIGTESIFYTPSPSPTFVARRPGFLESTPIIPINSAFTPISGRSASLLHDDGKSRIPINNNFASKLIEVEAGRPTVGFNHEWAVNQTPVTPNLCQTLPYSPFVISAHHLAHPQNIYPFPSHGSGLQNPNQILLFNPNASFGHGSGSSLQQTQCIFK